MFGCTLLGAAAFIFSYYTLWVVVTPFVDGEHPLHQYFPDRKWAIMIPTVLFVLVLAVSGTFVGNVMMQSAKKGK